MEENALEYISLVELMNAFKHSKKLLRKSNINFDKLRFIAYKNMHKDGLVSIERIVNNNEIVKNELLF